MELGDDAPGSSSSSVSVVRQVSLSESCLFQLAHLYSALGSDDVSLQLFSQSSSHPLTRSALHAALTQDYQLALQRYDAALQAYDEASTALAAGAGEREIAEVWRKAAAGLHDASRALFSPSASSSAVAASVKPGAEELELWNRGRLDSLRCLTDWSVLRANIVLDVDGELQRLFQRDEQEHGYIDHFLTAAIKQLQTSFIRAGGAAGRASDEAEDDDETKDAEAEGRLEGAQSQLSSFMRRFLSSPEFGPQLESGHCPRLLLYFCFQGSSAAPRARHYLERSYASFLQQWEQLPSLAHQTRARLLQSLQATTEIAEFMRAHPSMQAQQQRQSADPSQRWLQQLSRARQQLQRWSRRLPSALEPLSTWDDAVVNRASFSLTLYQELSAGAERLSALPEAKLRRSLLQSLAASLSSLVCRLFGKAAFVLADSHNLQVAERYLSTARAFLQAADTQGSEPLATQLFYQQRKLLLRTSQRDIELIRVQRIAAGSGAGGGDEAEQQQAAVVKRLTAALSDVVHVQTRLKLDSAEEQARDPVTAFRFLSLKAAINQQLAEVAAQPQQHDAARAGKKRADAAAGYSSDAVDRADHAVRPVRTLRRRCLPVSVCGGAEEGGQGLPHRRQPRQRSTVSVRGGEQQRAAALTVLAVSASGRAWVTLSIRLSSRCCSCRQPAAAVGLLCCPSEC